MIGQTCRTVCMFNSRVIKKSYIDRWSNQLNPLYITTPKKEKKIGAQAPTLTENLQTMNGYWMKKKIKNVHNTYVYREMTHASASQCTRGTQPMHHFCHHASPKISLGLCTISVSLAALLPSLFRSRRLTKWLGVTGVMGVNGM